MNLNEERNYQKLLEVLTAMELSEKNQKLAKEYLEPGQPENPELLKQAEPQDFSQVDKEKRKICTDYVEHLKKRGRMEEAGRYVRFAAAAGGSTACYMLISYGWNINSIVEFLSPAQAAAIRTEGRVWTQHSLNRRGMEELFKLGKEEPQVLLDAMELCYHKYDNAKVMLAAIYLNGSSPEKPRGGLFQAVLGGKKKAPADVLKKTVDFLTDSLKDSIPSMFSQAKPSQEEEKKLKDFVENSTLATPFPQEFHTMFQGKQFSNYLLTLLAGAAFLAVDHSPKCMAFLRMAAAMDLETMLDACLEIGDASWFRDRSELLENLLPFSEDAYILWCIRTGAKNGSGIREALARMAGQKPNLIKDAAAKVTTEEYQFLMEQVKAGNPKLYQEMRSSFQGKFDEKLAQELVRDIPVNSGQALAKQYLLGEETIESLFPYVYSWRGGYHYSYNRFQRLNRIKSNENQMFRRGVILEAFRMEGGYFTSWWLTRRGRDEKGIYKQTHEKQVEQLIRLFEKEDMPIQYQMDAMDSIYNSYYGEQEKAIFMDTAVKCLSSRYEARAQEFRDSTKSSTATGRGMAIRVLDSQWPREKETLFACAMDSSKQVREVLAAVYAGHKEWETDVKAMLESKKSQERELAVQVLKTWGAASYQEEFEQALQKEKSKKIREMLLKCLGVEAAAIEDAAPLDAEQLAAQILKGGKKRKVAWAYETPFTEVHRRNGNLAEEEYLQAVLVAYADMAVPGMNEDAKKLAAELDAEELSSYMELLFGKWLESGAEAKKKWVLYATAIHGGEKIVPALYHQIQDWPLHARGAMAAEAVKALALNGSAQALLLVDQISRKFKFRQVKQAAGDALTYAAEQLHITKEELEDRIVPNLGFNAQMEQTFDYGTRSFRVYLTPSLELEIYDGEGKKLKNLPAPGKRDEEEKAKAANNAFKQMKKQLKTVVANQKLRMEQAMGVGRLWQVAQWKELFVNNPVMHQFAMGLIWGLYEDGSLKETFRYMEDGSFNTVEEEEYEFPAEGTIGLVHPIELEEEQLVGWKEQLCDYEVVQPIEQLERPVYRLTEEEKTGKELTRFGGKLLNGLSLSGKLQAQGWYRGSVQDAGVYSTFYREDGEMGVELSFSGSYVGDENDEVTVYEAVFYKAGTVKRGSYVYDTVKEQNRYSLSEVPPRYFSEVVLQLSKATVSSQEQLPYPECKK